MVDLDSQALFECRYVPSVVLARVVAGKIGRSDIGDGFLVDMDYLEDN